MILRDLIGPNASPAGEVAGYPTDDIEWSLAGNDRYGDCVFVSLCNLLDLQASVAGKPFVIGEAEAERFYSVEAGFIAANPATDHGARMEDVLAYWQANGWPSDPACTLDGWCPITLAEVHQAVWSLGAVPFWAALPVDGDGEPDFTDQALGTDGTEAHAMLAVRSGPDGYRVVTWAEARDVSRAWMARFGRGWYAVKVTGWTVPILPQTG